MDFRQEGIVLKDIDSRYFFNNRKRGWFKVKPEYEGLSETLDLLVVGAFFGDSQRRRAGLGQSADLADNCAQFLLAARRGVGAENDEAVVTVARVGTGFSMDQLREIREKLRPHLRRYDGNRAPVWLGGWRGAHKAKPDAIIDSPRHAFVMEVRAAEIVPSEEYALGHTLRFPRAVTHIRDDKDWCDANTEQDLRDFIRGGRAQLTLRQARPKVEVESDGGDTDDAGRAPQSKRRRKGGGKGGGRSAAAVGSS